MVVFCVEVSSFCGVICFGENAVSIECVGRMLDCLDYWGPESRHVIVNYPVGMGHLMRRDVPESTQEIVPFETDNLIFVGDCRIDNREELAETLELYPIDRDSLFVIKAYQKWGDRCCEKLIGDFSFVIWDKLLHQAFCGRDHIGIKPFYYYQNPSFFAFSTEIKALFCVSEIQKKSNRRYLADVLTCGVACSQPYSDDTLFDGVVQLTPGHSLMVSVDRVSKYRYWRPEKLGLLNLSDEEITRELKHLVSQAVTCRLRSVGPIACELSGGLDSSLVTAIAAQTRPDLHAITHVPPKEPTPFLDETPFAVEVCHFLGVENCHYVDASDYDPEQSLKSVVHSLEGPNGGISVMYKEPIWKKAKSLNCGVVLSGFGGDECLSASASVYLKELATTGRWIQLFRRLKSLPQLAKLIFKTQFPVLMNWYLEWKVPHSIKIPTSKILSMYSKPPQGDFEPFINSYLSDINAIGLKGSTAFLIQGLTGADQRWGHHLRGSINAHSVAIKDVNYRFPLLDIRLIEFILRIPPSQRHPSGSHRYLIRQVMKGLLPDSIVSRRDKAGMIFPSTYYRWQKYYEIETGIQPSHLGPDLRYRAFLFDKACRAVAYDIV
jgi:asparagine synthase (glutamine-hydrolysing)